MVFQGKIWRLEFRRASPQAPSALGERFAKNAVVALDVVDTRISGWRCLLTALLLLSSIAENLFIASPAPSSFAPPLPEPSPSCAHALQLGNWMFSLVAVACRKIQKQLNTASHTMGYLLLLLLLFG